MFDNGSHVGNKKRNQGRKILFSYTYNKQKADILFIFQSGVGALSSFE